MNSLSKNIRNIMILFLFCFVGLISYIAYFQVFKGDKIAQDTGNKRLWAQRNEVLRGTIYDKDGNVLASSYKIDEFSQGREYPYGRLYSHAIGYIDENYGLTGLEDEFDSTLSKHNGFTNDIRSFFKDFDFKEFVDSSDEELIGNSVYTTLDTNLQQIASDALGDNNGAVVAINPESGEILAMVSKPTYDPSDIEAAMTEANNQIESNGMLLNKVLYGKYPPASIFKTLTLSAALEKDSSVKDRIFNDVGKITFDDGTTLNNFQNEVHGEITLKNAYRFSSNFVFGTLAMEMGNDYLKEMAERFGFNSNLQGKGVYSSKSTFPKLDSNELGNIAQSGIGQGSVITTPLQMAIMASAIANDGTIMEPTLLDKIVDKNSNLVDENKPEVFKSNVVSKETAATVKEYMGNLIENNIYRWPAFSGTNAGGKTGTADYKKDNGEDGIPHGWFISIAPLDNPQIAVAVIVEEGESGAYLAADVASRVVRYSVLGY